MVETTNRQPKGFFRKSPVNFDFAGLTEELNNLYFSDACCISDLADGDETDVFTEAELEGFVTRVYEGAFKDGSFDKSRVNKYAKVFSKALIKGYTDGKKQAVKIDNDSPDAKMIDALKKNVFHFSVAKNKTEIKAMSEALLDANEKLRTFKDFTTEAKKIAEDFQGRYMKVEYDLAVNASTTAARWVEYDDEDILVYQTAGDSRVRPEHRKLDGVAKPKSDPFWNTYYPPLSWNCRCTTVVTHSGRITPKSEVPADAIDGVPPMFRSNFAKEGFVFPPSHPYFKEKVSESEIKKAKK